MFRCIGHGNVATCVNQLERLGEPSYFAEHLLDLGRLTYIFGRPLSFVFAVKPRLSCHRVIGARLASGGPG